MLYFIPSWYSPNGWKENEQSWYKRRTQNETDDTIKQIQLFHRNKVFDYKIMLLSFAPNFRHFLHRQSVYRANYWSLFDSIQEITRKKQSILSFHNLKWPDNIEFVYTPFVVVAMLNYEKYAEITFGEYGNPIVIDLYQNNTIIRKNYYDDRGFVSCTSIYENGKRIYDQYLSENGIWKLCHYSNGKVQINENNNTYLIETINGEEHIPFKKIIYDSMDEVIKEVLTSYLANTNDDDIFTIAAHYRNLKLVKELFADKKTIFSIFNNRITLNDEIIDILSMGKYVIIDSDIKYDEYTKNYNFKNAKIVNIPPYDTRIDYGISQQLHVQNILLPIDSLSQPLFDKTIYVLAKYLKTNKDARVHLFTRNNTFGYEDIVLNNVCTVLNEKHFPVEWARKPSNNKYDLTPEDEANPILFIVDQCLNEIAVNKCVREQRVMVDLANKPDLFLQISCVSMGIPQIVRTKTQYIEHNKNGRIIDNLRYLSENLAFYLENLTNWNDAMINSYKLGQSHSSEYLINKWKEVIEDIGNN